MVGLAKCELVLKGNQDSDLHLLRMMVDNDLTKFRYNWIYKFLMCNGGTLESCL